MASELVKVDGLKELNALLSQLPIRIEKNIMRTAITAAARVVRDKAKELAPVDSGKLRRSIRVGSSRVRGGKAQVNVYSGEWYSHFLEFGTASYYTGKGKSAGKPYSIPKKTRGGRISRNKKALAFGNGIVVNNVTHPGIKPRPFMRPAFDRGSAPAIEAFRQNVANRLQSEVAKLWRPK